ncbi:MAG: 50S ribosomal protein L23 [Deltaproteobacteria bacterium]|nr:50S ribosomal protein L23 [Deltaproteobacteria bacterium]
MTIYDVIKKPLVTEKSNVLKEANGTYVFEVNAAADKPLIKKSVEELFGVKVKSVQTSIQPGKYKRFGKAAGKTKAVKKAMVTLSEGKIELFEGV